ncbi:MAG: hypothetical protein QME93_07890 [Bacillota bacterium]|nr:hypothetical protein [Bacillota bacterium]MDI7249974.1 hypothetical protein [Bacillota bacterium]
MSAPGSSNGWALAEVVVAVALSALLFIALLDISWRVPALSARVREGFWGASSARSAFLALCRDLRGASKVLDVSDALLRLEVGGQEVSWSFSGGELVRSAGGVEKRWFFSDARFRRDGNLVEACLDGPAGPLRTAVMVYEGGG